MFRLIGVAIIREYTQKLYVVRNMRHCPPTPVAERSKAWVWSLSHAGIAGSNSADGLDVCLL
jgi:hypothetical protein